MKDRSELVEGKHPALSVRKQCVLLGVTRSSLAYESAAETPENLRIKRLLDETYLIDPCLGSRRLVTVLDRDHGITVNRKRLQRLRREIGHEAIWCKPRTSIPEKAHRKYPYLLRELRIARPDQVWCADITYVPMPGGHAYLCAVMDGHSRKVLGWALSNTMENGPVPRGAGERAERHGAGPGNLQHRPRLPVHLGAMDGPPPRAWGEGQHGRARTMDGQGEGAPRSSSSGSGEA